MQVILTFILKFGLRIRKLEDVQARKIALCLVRHLELYFLIDVAINDPRV